MCPGREKSLARAEGEINERIVSARSCAEMPVVVPVQNAKFDFFFFSYYERMSERRGEKLIRTVSVVNGDGVCCFVPVLVVGYHYGDVELVQPFTR